MQKGMLLYFPKLPKGILSHDTFRRVLMLVGTDCLFECGSACRPHLTDAARDGPLGYARKE